MKCFTAWPTAAYFLRLYLPSGQHTLALLGAAAMNMISAAAPSSQSVE
jgi:hypothetical protein